MKEGYKVLSHTFRGYESYMSNDKVYHRYKYEIDLNKSTKHTLRLWNGIEKGLDMYEKYENTKNPFKRLFIKWFMGY